MLGLSLWPFGVEFLPRRAFGQLSRRACLAAPLTAVAFGRPPTAAASGDLSAAAVSSGDDLAVISTARKLDGVLADWDAEIALVQLGRQANPTLRPASIWPRNDASFPPLGRQGALQSSANLLQEDALKRLGAGARAAGGGESSESGVSSHRPVCREQAPPARASRSTRTQC